MTHSRLAARAAFIATVLLALPSGLALADGAGWTLPTAPLPLAVGPQQELRGHLELAPGLALDLIRTGTNSPADHFEVNVGFARRPDDAEPLRAALTAAGYETKLVASADDGATGFMVRLAKPFAAQDAADAAVAALKSLKTLPAASETLAVGIGRVFTAEDGGPTAGPFQVELLSIKPGFTGDVVAALASDIVPGRETTSALAARKGATAAINGGFFQLGRANGTDGGLAGLSVIDGRLVSEGVEGRPALFIRKESDGRTRAWIERRLSTRVTVAKVGAEPRRIDGLNRRPQVSVNCGRAADAETALPMHDAVCTNADAIILFTGDFGAGANNEFDGDAIAVTEVSLDAKGIVEDVRTQPGGPIPAGGQVLQGIGKGAEWLAATFRKGDAVKVDRKLVNGEGQEIALSSGLYAVNGGPTLLVKGAIPQADWAGEGWQNQTVGGYAWSKQNGNRANFFNGWVLRRNPRTAVGIAADGTLLMLVVDGRAPRFSAGLSIPETARLMGHFGAVEAINLDGGGSSMLWAAGAPRTLPSDAGNAERPDGDAILVFAR